jgi:putative oxidoreductase
VKFMLLRILHWICRLGLAGIFLYTGYIKLESPLQFAAVLYGYKLFPTALIMTMTRYFPWVEIALAVLLLLGWRMRYVALGACGLIAAFIGILAITYLRGIDANCGCFSFGDRITPLTIVRDGLILLPALYLAAESVLRTRHGVSAAPPASDAGQ